MSDQQSLYRTILHKAADLLREHGFVRGARKAWDGKMCLLGALDEAQQNKMENTTAALAALIVPYLPTPTVKDEDTYNHTVMTPTKNPVSICAWWSNMRAEDAEEVALKLEEVADGLETA